MSEVGLLMCAPFCILRFSVPLERSAVHWQIQLKIPGPRRHGETPVAWCGAVGMGSRDLTLANGKQASTSSMLCCAFRRSRMRVLCTAAHASRNRAFARRLRYSQQQLWQSLVAVAGFRAPGSGIRRMQLQSRGFAQSPDGHTTLGTLC